MVAVCAWVLGFFAFVAASLLVYPWDWAPDEGLALDHARRWLASGPRALYGDSVVPFPDFYGPLLPLLLTPFAASPAPLPLARIVPLAVTVLLLLPAGLLAARVGGARAGWTAASLVLAQSYLSVWLLLIRADAAAVALWLWAAVAVLPARLEPGADRLGWPRATLGAFLLVVGVLTRPTTLLVGAPLALGWWLVDRRSAARFSAALLATGLAGAGLMHLVTSGGHLATAALWATHGAVPGQVTRLLLSLLRDWWALFLAAGLGSLAVALKEGRLPRDGGLLLCAGGALMVPALAKGGAAINYLLPLTVATAVYAVRVWSAWAAGALAARRTLALLPPALAAIALVGQQGARTPSRGDAATAGRFYALLAKAREATAAPLLALTPDYAYVLQGQTVEMHGSALRFLERRGAPGIERILERLQAGHYGAVVMDAQYWPDRPEWNAALHQRYRLAGSCRLGYFYGDVVPFYVMVRRDTSLAFTAEPGCRCEPPAAVVGPGR